MVDFDVMLTLTAMFQQLSSLPDEHTYTVEDPPNILIGGGKDRSFGAQLVQQGKNMNCLIKTS